MSGVSFLSTTLVPLEIGLQQSHNDTKLAEVSRMPTLFPSGIAYGMAFYDRSNERRNLKKAIDNNIHTTLTAPRRFGKTSLMRKVIEDNKYPFVWIDMMAFTSREQAEEQILQHVAQSVVKIGGTEERIKQLAKKFLSYLKPEIVASVVNTVSLKLTLAKPEDKPVDFITTLLINLDSIAQTANQRAVFVFDEFQEIIHLEDVGNNAFQGAIRHAVEQSQNVTYIFSGSKQETLRSLFTGKKSPLYELCSLFSLSLIPEEFYKQYLKEVSTHRWSRDIGEASINRILHHSACYPKYVNSICQALWASEEEPTVELIDKLWEDFMFIEVTH